MAFVLPLPLPESLVSERRVVPKHDFLHRHYTVAFGPDGRGYVHSELFYNYRRYDQGEGGVEAQLVTLLSRNFSISGQVWLEALHHEMTHEPNAKGGYVFDNDLAPLAVTAHGEVVFSTQQNRMFVYDADVKQRLARFDPLRGEPAGFSDLVPVPGGLVVVRSKEQVSVALDPPPLRDGLPGLREVASVTALIGELATHGYRGRFAALDSDRILVTSFERRGRSGWINSAAFDYVVLAGDGRKVGRFALGAGDTPYGKVGAHDESIVTHHGLGAWLVRSDAALHAFNRDAKRLLRIGLDKSGRFAAIAPLRLIGVAPTGEVLLVHEKHHLLVVTDPVMELSGLEAVLADAGAVYASELSRLKKVVPFANGRWFGFETETPRALAKPGKKAAVSRKPKLPAPVARPPEVAKNPAQQVSLAPQDVTALLAYAKSLTSSDADLAEYIELGVALERLAEADPEREPKARLARSLFFRNAARWLARWNQPVALFDRQSPKFCGLPCGVALSALPRRLSSLDDQLSGLPIQSLSISGMSASDIHGLAGLATLRRITALEVQGSSKRRLGKTLLAWVAEQSLSNLRQLRLTGVATTGAGLCAVVATTPQLDGLTICDGELSKEGLDELATSASAARLEDLSLRYTAMGSAAATIFGRFPKLRKLNIQALDIGDDVAESAPPRMTATDVDFADNPRFGADAMAWFVRALPDLRKLRLPGTLPSQAFPALLPLAPQLDSLDCSWLKRPARQALVKTVLPKAAALRRLILTGSDGEGLGARIIDQTELHELDLGDVKDADVAACARATSLRVLRLGDGASDESLGSLVSSAQFPDLRMLHVHSHALTEKGLCSVLDAPWPKLERIELMYAQIRDASIVAAPSGRDLVLRLFLCKVPKKQLEKLRQDWGERLIVES